MNNLVKYDAACRAIAEAKAVDEVKDIRDKAEAMRLYGRQAKNRQLEADAWAIKERAEIRLGELIRAQKETVGLNRGRAGQGRPNLGAASKEEPNSGLQLKRLKFVYPPERSPTLPEMGIDHKLSSRAQKKASLPKFEQERLINEGHKEILDAADKASARIVKAAEIKEVRKVYDERKEQGGQVADLHALAKSGEKYPVIYADPPWKFEVYSGKGKVIPS